MKLISIIFLSIVLIVIGLLIVKKIYFAKSNIDYACKEKYPKIIFKDEGFSFQFLRTLEKSVYQSSDIGESFVTADQIKEGDFESWYEQWLNTAQRINKNADEVLLKGYKESAKSSYLRASEYYRAAGFYLNGNKQDPRIFQTWKKSHDCFEKFIELSTLIEPVKIPYQGIYLPGYFYHVNDSKKPRSTIILQTGYDGTIEELHSFAIGATKRGYNVLTFEGPGQGGVIIQYGLPFRPDWENVIKPVVDYVISRAEVDSKGLVLYGLSFGGYLAPRAAAYEDRIKIVIANGGIYDFSGNIVSLFKMPFKSKNQFLQWLKNNQEEFNKMTFSIMKVNANARWFIEHGMYVMDAGSPAEFILKLSEYNLEKTVQKIKCRILVVDSQNESELLVGQAKLLYDNLKSEKEYMLFKTDEGAGLHCQTGARILSNQRIYDWLDENI